MIYFVEMLSEGLFVDDDLRLIKIGYTKNSKERVSDLQVGCPFKLSLLRKTPGDRPVESWLHAVRFASYAFRNEWFRFTAAMLTIDPEAEYQEWLEHRSRLGASTRVSRPRTQASAILANAPYDFPDDSEPAERRRRRFK